ncbi:MFS transporter [Solimonas sp. SE-A11]|uniref:MFS transporter n=1 Tax=Solimonas sp. SE-A11 TaxID=3054954 RepID=UPI00259CB0AA|nr:MFS transporter [Solimonas sp. SE-A11]MDM4769024.1 MFS transporter [Solimonas sp. SE-A11]
MQAAPKTDTDTAPSGPAETRAVRWALVGLSLSVLLSSLGTSSANVALPTLAQVFSASFQQVQWIVLAYLLAITTLVVGVGRLGDVAGRRRLLVAGIALFTAASVLCGLAPTLWMLIGARAVQGLGAAVMMSLTMAFVGETVPRERSGSAMGLLGTMSAVGTALGPSLGGLLISEVGWRAIFFINLPLGLLAFGLCRRYLPDVPRTAPGAAGRFDVTGTVLLALTLAAYALAMTLGRGSLGVLNLGLLLAAAMGLVLLLRVEVRAATPLLRLAMFREPVLRAGLATGVLVTTVMMATLVVGPFYLSRALGLDAAVVGLVMAAGPLIAAVVGLPGGQSVDRHGAQRITVGGLMGMVVGCAALSRVPVSLGIPGYVIPLVILTAGYALFQVANNTAVMAGVAADQRGLVSGMIGLSRNLGLVTGAAVLGAVFAAAAGAADIHAASPDAVAHGMRVTFGVAALLILLAAGIAVGVGHARRGA